MRSIGIAVGALALAGTVSAQVTERVSVATDGGQGNAQSGSSDWSGVAVSADGRFVAFESRASNLVPGDTNGRMDVFVRDRASGATERVSVDDFGAEANGDSRMPSISADGSQVAFVSFASNLVSGDTNRRWDVFVHDRRTGATTRVNVDAQGRQTAGDSEPNPPSITADGRLVAFQSFASDLVGGDDNDHLDVFVYDRFSGTPEIESVATNGTIGNSNSQTPAISAQGRYVAFVSLATNLVSIDVHQTYETYVHDRWTGATTIESVAANGSAANADSGMMGLSISDDGRYLAFASYANNIAPGSAVSQDIYVRDRTTGVNARCSRDGLGHSGNGESSAPSISFDGRYVAYVSAATNLVPGDTNGSRDIFLFDRVAGVTERASVSMSLTQGNADSGRYGNVALSGDGRYVVFGSESTSLVDGDTNAVSDVFLRDTRASGFTSLCEPGQDGVRGCPCANSPFGLGTGCNNSSGTGGASLSASGIAYLSIEGLTFTTSGENPDALSILLQGDATIGSGQVFGQGVSCLGGTQVRRLYVKQAFQGSIRAPDLGAGDPTVSARSAALGDVIGPGESRWYLVYYRDPVVHGGCPADHTFNATQTGRVSWWP